VATAGLLRPARKRCGWPKGLAAFRTVGNCLLITTLSLGASGLAHALHHAIEGNHSEPNCPVCCVFRSSSAYVADPPSPLIRHDRTCLASQPPREVPVVRLAVRASLAPRAPPSYA